jgi:hypothetical protein
MAKMIGLSWSPHSVDNRNACCGLLQASLPRPGCCRATPPIPARTIGLASASVEPVVLAGQPPIGPNTSGPLDLLSV